MHESDRLHDTESSPAVVPRPGDGVLVAAQPEWSMATGYYLHLVRPFRQDKSKEELGAPHLSSTHQSGSTRIGSAWMAVAVAVVLGVALIDFIVQNTRSVRIEFFSVNGQIPVAVALLAAAVAGGLVVLVAGVARTTQLRLTRHRERRSAAADMQEPVAAVEPTPPPPQVNC